MLLRGEIRAAVTMHHDVVQAMQYLCTIRLLLVHADVVFFVPKGEAK
jgi:hypothetical protein